MITLILFLASIMLHPLHLTVIEIEHNPSSQTLEVTCKIFIDDFENALKKSSRSKVDLYDETFYTKYSPLIQKYLFENLQITQSGKRLHLELLGFEKDKEAMFVFLESGKISSTKDLKIANSILYELFDDQASIVNFSAEGKRVVKKTLYPNLIAELW